MSLRRTLLTAFLSSTLLLTACTLRSRYKDVVQPTGTQSVPGQVVVLRVVDADSGRPVMGAQVRAGESRTRLSTTSDAEGLVTLQVSKELLTENPLVEVVLPKGVSNYRLQLVPSGQAPAPEAAPEATPEAPAAQPGAAPETAAPATPPSTETVPSTEATPDAGT